MPPRKPHPQPEVAPPRIGLALAVFTRRTPEAQLQLVEQFESYCSRFRKNLCWFQDDDHEEWRELSDELVGYLRRRWLSTRRRKAGDVGVYAHGAEYDLDASPNFISVLGSADDLDEVYGLLEMWDESVWSPGQLVEEAMSICRKMQPLSGYAGYGSAPWVDMETAQDGRPALFAISQRFEGVEIQPAWFTKNAKKSSLPVVQWLTIVSDELLERVGGRNALDGLPEGVFLHDYGAGVVIQAGLAPSPGDLNKGDKLPLYRAVATRLKKLRHRDPLPLIRSDRDSSGKEETLKWYRRLERDP